jgi:NAD(P)-dependent dehydrogenase (short-subunit alcohol dehydrogenase family)
MEIKGKMAIITGSTGKLGRELVKAIAAAGADCICHYHTNKAEAERLVGQVKAMGQKAVAINADLTDEKQVERLFKEAADFSPPQILINSAAVFERKKLDEITYTDAKKMFDINAISPIICCKYFAGLVGKNFKDVVQPVAKIINITDVSAIKPWAEYCAYCASRAAAVSATKSLAKELAPAFCVNTLAVGIVNWPADFDEQQKKRQLSFIPAARIGQACEVAAAVKFLIENDYITGQILCVDGGRSI